MDVDDILTELKNDIDAKTGLSAEIIATSLEITGTGAFTISEVKGGIGGQALTAYQDSVDNITNLSAESKHGRVVKIQNTGGAADTYYAKFVATNGISGPGVWEETIGPGVSTGLDATTCLLYTSPSPPDQRGSSKAGYA